ncbi:MAG: glycoside hydrolase family 1 protein [Candidatus Portnoybacteria bacterium]|nr:glycoside hydrolase family 1 protein [Candidatus Portnoybacteria bacterium]
MTQLKSNFVNSENKANDTGKLIFPSGFLWGAATSAHQVEGNNHNDWSEWEKANAERLAKEAKDNWQPWQQEKFPEMFEPQNYISGRACDHYNRFAEDFDIAKSLGHNAHRFSIEWSRVEPEEGRFDQEAIEHYKKVVQALRNKNIEPFFTINHLTLPFWFAERGGWQRVDSVFLFGRFVDKIANNFKDDVTFWITLNEPWIYLSHSFLRGIRPPQKKSISLCLLILLNLINAHKTAHNVIKSYNKQAKIGFAENFVCFEGWLSWFAHWWIDFRFLNSVRKRIDFLGVNYYFHSKIKGLKFSQNDNKKVSDLGWEIYPKGIYRILKRLKKYQKPIYILENGNADAEDEKRERFIKDHLFWIHRAIRSGVDVRGYLYWSLLDNFEWEKGFWPRFGLVEVDHKTMERKIRPSAYKYAEICKNNSLN